MKVKSAVAVSILILSLFVLSASKSIQDKLTFEGVYDGKEDYGYNFVGANTEGDEYTMTFQKIDPSLLESFDLKSEKLVGSKFSVTYTTSIKVTKDENGFDEEEETNTIVALKAL